MKLLLQSVGIAALAGLCLFGSNEALGQKKNKKAAATQFPADAKDYAAIQSIKELVGTIQSSDAKSLTLRIDIPHYEPNPKYKPATTSPQFNNQQMQHMQRLANLQNQLNTARTPQQANNIMNQMMQEQQRMQQQMAQQYANFAKAANNPNNSPYLIKYTFKDFDLDFADKIAVRKIFLETGYDDKGNLIEYTKAKLAELRGPDSKLPGFTAKFDEVQTGMLAKLSLNPVKTPSKSSSQPSSAAKAKDEDPGIGNVERPTIRLILLLQEAKDNKSAGATSTGAGTGQK